MPLFEFDQDRNPWLPRAEYYVQISSGRTRRRDLENIGRRDSRWPVPQIPDESQFAVHLPTEMMQLGDHHSSSKPTLSLSAHKLANKRNPRETRASETVPAAISSVRVRFRETHRSQSRKDCGDLNLYSDTDARSV